MAAARPPKLAKPSPAKPSKAKPAPAKAAATPPPPAKHRAAPPPDRHPDTMTEAQRAYEAKRAAKAGMSLDKWLDSKRRQQEQEARAREKAAEAPRKPGLLKRLLDRAHKPL